MVVDKKIDEIKTQMKNNSEQKDFLYDNMLREDAEFKEKVRNKKILRVALILFYFIILVLSLIFL